MPELVNISVGSLAGTSGLDGTTLWPRWAKKSRKVWRISATEATGGVGVLEVMVWRSVKPWILFASLGFQTASNTDTAPVA